MIWTRPLGIKDDFKFKAIHHIHIAKEVRPAHNRKLRCFHKGVPFFLKRPLRHLLCVTIPKSMLDFEIRGSLIFVTQASFF